VDARPLEDSDETVARTSKIRSARAKTVSVERRKEVDRVRTAARLTRTDIVVGLGGGNLHPDRRAVRLRPVIAMFATLWRL